MREYLPLLIAGAIIGSFTVIFTPALMISSPTAIFSIRLLSVHFLINPFIPSPQIILLRFNSEYYIKSCRNSAAIYT